VGLVRAFQRTGRKTYEEHEWEKDKEIYAPDENRESEAAIVTTSLYVFRCCREHLYWPVGEAASVGHFERVGGTIQSGAIIIS
jgi:hypothetical protein